MTSDRKHSIDPFVFDFPVICLNLDLPGTYTAKIGPPGTNKQIAKLTAHWRPDLPAPEERRILQPAPVPVEANEQHYGDFPQFPEYQYPFLWSQGPLTASPTHECQWEAASDNSCPSPLLYPTGHSHPQPPFNYLLFHPPTENDWREEDHPSDPGQAAPSVNAFWNTREAISGTASESSPELAAGGISRTQTLQATFSPDEGSSNEGHHDGGVSDSASPYYYQQYLSPHSGWSQNPGALHSPTIYAQSGTSGGSPSSSPLLPIDSELSLGNIHSPHIEPPTWNDWGDYVDPSEPAPPVPPAMTEMMALTSNIHDIYPVSLDPAALWNRRTEYLQQHRHPNQTFYYKCSWPVGSGKCSASFNQENDAFGHIGGHIARAKFACSCGKTYTEERSAKRHQRTERVKFDGSA
ncbi:hypothetical protein M422DRAFT_64779 [Sphaerobolus stellatus SS14]|nr:hypothetical protein M422DRAFT_64779 [Sphaerobolus stellatus SS14]